MFVTRGIYGVGLDTPSLDPGKNEQFIAHQTLLGASLFGIENLNLSTDKIPGKLKCSRFRLDYIIFLLSMSFRKVFQVCCV